MGKKGTDVRAWIVTVMHIAAFAQLGVLTREYLDKMFQDGCERSWGLCLTSDGKAQRSLGSYYTDLPSNILGSFIMGAVSTSAAVGLSDRKAVAMLPAGSTLQGNAPLLAGVRTGYCGSLTTFSAWQLQNVLLLVGGRGRDGGQWAQALWSVVIGMMTALASLTAGHHVAIAVARHLYPDTPVFQAQALPVRVSPDVSSASSSARSRSGRREIRNEDIRGSNSFQMSALPRSQPRGKHGVTAASAVATQPQQDPAAATYRQSGPAAAAQPDSDQVMPQAAHRTQLLRKSRDEHWDEEAQLGAHQQGPYGAGGTRSDAEDEALQPSSGWTASGRSAPRRPAPGWLPGGVNSTSGRDPRDEGQEVMVEDEEDLGAEEEGPRGADEVEEEEEQEADADAASDAAKGLPRRQWRHDTRMNVAVGILCAALTASFITAAVVDNDDSHTGRRTIWLGVLLGIPGAVLRWLLADLNFTLPGRASWLPAGTLAANTLAVIVIFAVQIPGDRGPLQKWSGIWVTAVQSGFCGALSTVSTFVNELVQMFNEELPGYKRGYLYMVLSFALAWAFGILIYGTTHWVM